MKVDLRFFSYAAAALGFVILILTGRGRVIVVMDTLHKWTTMEIRIRKKRDVLHTHVHVTHLVMYDIQNARTQLSTITTTVFHGPVHVGLGALACLMVKEVLINVLRANTCTRTYIYQRGLQTIWCPPTLLRPGQSSSWLWLHYSCLYIRKVYISCLDTSLYIPYQVS